MPSLKCVCVCVCVKVLVCTYVFSFSTHGVCVCSCMLVGAENKSSMTMAVVARVTHSQGSNWSKRSQIHDPAKIHNL